MEELNPFSYKEFLRWKSQDAEPDQEPKPVVDLRLDLEHTKSQVAGLQLHGEQQMGSALNLSHSVLAALWLRGQEHFLLGSVAGAAGRFTSHQ